MARALESELANLSKQLASQAAAAKAAANGGWSRGFRLSRVHFLGFFEGKCLESIGFCVIHPNNGPQSPLLRRAKVVWFVFWRTSKKSPGFQAFWKVIQHVTPTYC